MAQARAINITIRAKDEASQAFRKTRQSMTATEKAAGTLKSAVGALGVSFGVAGLVGVLKRSVDEFMRFETAVSRIGTLIPGQRQLLGTLSDQADLLSRTYGLLADDVATATFQAVSAGVDAGKATEFMAVAAQSATAGFSSMEETVQGLTTIINAYGLEASEATRISDAMFTANKLGVTTTRELSQHMGTVVSVASSLKVSYHDIFSATVALTKQGLNTGRSMVSLRGILASLISPSEDAAKAAEEYGLQWNGAMVRARGMVGIMEELQKANEAGGTELISRLIPNVRALSGAMALASSTGISDFNRSLTEMTTRSGQTAEALKEVTDTAAHQYKVAMEELSSVSRDLGATSIPVVNRALDFVSTRLRDAAQSGKSFESLLRTLLRVNPMTVTSMTLLEAAFGSFKGSAEQASASTRDSVASLVEYGEEAKKQVQFLADLRRANEEAMEAEKKRSEQQRALASFNERQRKAHEDLVAAGKKYMDGLRGYSAEEEAASVITVNRTAAIRRQTEATNALAAARRALGEFKDVPLGGVTVETEGRNVSEIMSAQRSAAMINEAKAVQEAELAYARFRHEMGFFVESKEKMGESAKDSSKNILKDNEDVSRGMQQFADVTASAFDAAISGESNFAAAMQNGTNAVLRGLAKQATARALMEGALALGALALGDTKQAGLHGAAAAKFAMVAGVGFAASKAVGTSSSDDGRGSGERASASQGLSAIAPAGSAGGGQRTEIYNITIQGSLIRQAELGTAVGRALDEARRRGAAPRR